MSFRSAPVALMAVLLSGLAFSAPAIDSLFPRSVLVGTANAFVTANGSGLDAGAQVLWNGIALPAPSRGPSFVIGTIPPSFVASPTTANITVKNSDGSISNALTFVVAAPVSITTPPTLPQANVGTYYSIVLTASGGVHQYLTNVYLWTLVSGALPPGMNLSLYGAFYGTPQSPGVYRFTVQVADSYEYSKSTLELTLVVSGGLTISPGTLPPGYVDSVYSQTLAATGGAGPYSWSVAAGSLPQGLSLSPAGKIEGTPAAAGTVPFTVKVVDTGTKSGTAQFSLTIGPPLGPVFIGSTPHIAAQSDWVTTFTLVNKGTKTAQTQTKFFGDSSAPGGGGPLTLPLVFPQQATALSTASLDQNISANASLIVQTDGPQSSPLQIGSAQFLATGSVDGFAIFRLIPGAQEAVVPMETRHANSYLLAFDNTGGTVLGVAVASVSPQPGNVGVVIRDESGVIISDAGASLVLAANDHTSFVLPQKYPVTANKRGTIEFLRPAGGRISVLGIRTTPLNSTFTLTTIPALANVGTGGGSIAHVATGSGWRTTFVLVNTSGSAAEAQLSFFATGSGIPLAIPLSFPQAGSGANVVASSVGRTIAAGAMLVVQSEAPLADVAPTIGSAQLATTGAIGGFVIFRYTPNGQEAVVPLESRNASGYLVAFDNTGGNATGIAVNSVSPQQVSVPVIVREDTGSVLKNDAITLSPNGHLSFTLAVDKYPETANKRGTIEFVTPSGAQIGVLGIRIPPALTFTTLPALAK